MSTLIKATRRLTSPISGNPIAQGALITSDTFSRADTGDIVGTSTDAGRGGRPLAWQGYAAGIGVNGGKAVRGSGTGTFATGLQIASPDCDVSCTIISPLSAGNFYLDFRRQDMVAGGSPDGYRVQFFTGTLVVTKRTASGVAQLIPSAAYKAGDALRVLMKGQQITLLINGSVVGDATDDAVQGSGFVGFAGTTQAAGFAIDNFEVRSA